jgi:hypothetical protein
MKNLISMKMISKLEIKINEKNTVYSFNKYIRIATSWIKKPFPLFKFRNGFTYTIQIEYYYQ